MLPCYSDVFRFSFHSLIAVLSNVSSLNCLLYADDLTLMLISHSATGLKMHCPHSQFLHDWMMRINTKKTKAVIFQNKNRKERKKKNKKSIMLKVTTSLKNEI